jgi:hypothetical protein
MPLPSVMMPYSYFVLESAGYRTDSRKSVAGQRENWRKAQAQAISIGSSLSE